MAQAHPHEFGAFSVLTGLRGATVIVRPSGELDMSTAAYFHTRLRQAMAFNTPPRVVVDAEDLAFCDSSGLSVLVAALREIEAAGGRFVLSGLNARLLRILKITGLDRKLQVYRTVDEAAAHLAATP
ncbi:STAS domain-containing protein [Streptosporangium sp. H16]|uniref:STAS domain-containing protein n=1 Tax=Streptosporangium sp. H16 TaxID=3444184 RepID=UPI003F7B0A0F